MENIYTKENGFEDQLGWSVIEKRSLLEASSWTVVPHFRYHPRHHYDWQIAFFILSNKEGAESLRDHLTRNNGCRAGWAMPSWLVMP